MTSPLEDLRERLRAVDDTILRALSARTAFPRNPRPRWPETETRLPPAPLEEILLAISPPGTAKDSPSLEKANRDLIDGLFARQQLGVEVAEFKTASRPDDYRAAIEVANRDVILSLLTDLPTEVRLLEHIRKIAETDAPNLPEGLAPLLWREYIIPWTRQVEMAHLLEP